MAGIAGRQIIDALQTITTLELLAITSIVMLE